MGIFFKIWRLIPEISHSYGCRLKFITVSQKSKLCYVMKKQTQNTEERCLIIHRQQSLCYNSLSKRPRDIDNICYFRRNKVEE